MVRPFPTFPTYLTRLLFLPVLLCLAAGGATAQVTFSEVHLSSGGGERAWGIAASDERVVVIGTTNAGAVDRASGLVHALNHDGELIATRRIGGPTRTFGRSVTPLDDGTFLLGTWVNSHSSWDDYAGYRVDGDLNVLHSWRSGTEEEDEELRRVVPLRNGRYLVVGNLSSTNAAYAYAMDTDGRIAWRTLLPLDDRDFNFFTDAVELADGTIFLAGFGILSGNREDSRLFTARISATGELLTASGYAVREETSIGARSVLLRPDGNLTVVTSFAGGGNSSRILLLTLTPDGDVVESLAVGNPGGARVADALLTDENNYLLTGRTTEEDNVRGFAVLVNLFGNVQRERTVGLIQPSMISRVRRAPGGGYLFAGTVGGCDGDSDDMLVAYLTDDLSRPDGCDQQTTAFRPIPAPTVERFPLTGEMSYAEEFSAAPPLEANETRAKRIGCPVFDLDADDGSGASTVGGYRHPPFCLDGEFGFLEDDLGLEVLPDSVEVRFSTAAVLRLAGSPIRFRRTPGFAPFLTLYPSSLAELRVALLALRADELVRTDNDEHLARFTAHYGCATVLEAAAEIQVLGRRIDSPLRDTVLCPGTELLLDATTETATEYSWGGDAGATNGTEARLTVNAPGTYVATLSNSCTTLIDTVTVRPIAGELARWPDRDVVRCAGDSLSVDLSLPTADRYSWSDGFTGPRRVLGGNGRWTVTIGNACQSTETSIRLRTESCCEVYFPTAFSPNGDGLNDRFGAFPAALTCGGLDGYELEVYGRWGESVFTAALPEAHWDGRWRDRPAPAGVYAYRVTYFDGIEQIARTGTFTLIR